jgi:DNA-binding beta-propeller fold protein YncE
VNSKHSPCPECGGTTPFARNHYFNGKMLVEQDFNEEQRYHSAKLQYHQKHLHGHGVACGLKVTPHPTPACRDRLVVIEPGAAFDCCGRTIAVRDKACFSFVDAPAVAALPKDDKNEHVLQICIRYTECATDLVPVLFDETSDGSRCEPNRVIESFEFDVMVDPPTPKVDATAPKFAWKNTLKAANARAVVLHENSHRLYILTASNPGTVFPVNADNRDFLTPLTPGGKGEALAISKDGKALVVAITVTTGLKLRAFDVADLTKAPVELTLPAGTTTVELALAPDGRLFGLVQAASVMTVQTWGSSLLTGSPIAPTKIADAPATATQPVFSTDGTILYLVDKGPRTVVSYDLKNATPTAATVTLPTGASAGLIALANDTAGDTLVVSDTSGTTIRFRAPDGTWSSATVPLAPTALVASRGGAWLYILATDGTDFFVRAISIHRARNNQPQPPNAVVKVGKGSGQPVFSASGNTLFVPFLGETTITAGLDGGVAVVDVAEQDCGELFWKSLDGCPSCDEPDCIVLATIEHYHVGDKLEDPTDPPAAVSLDKTNHVARIDNRKGRVLLPSTQVLTDVIRCLLEEGHGGDGKQGPPGLKGADGVSVKTASAESVAFGAPAQATFDPIAGEIHFKIPKGDKGDPGSVPTTKLVSICGINWHHAPQSFNDKDLASMLNAQGLLIAFNGKVRAGDINQHSFMVLTRRSNRFPVDAGNMSWDELTTKTLRGVQLKTTAAQSCPQLSIADPVNPEANTFVNGAQFLPAQGFVPGQEYRVILKGDLIRSDAGDGTRRSLDGNHLFPWVPSRPSGDGIEGGTFESWFATKPQ